MAIDNPGTLPTIVAKFPLAESILVMWQRIPVTHAGRTDVEAVVDKFLQWEDGWRKGRYRLGAAIGWQFTARNLLTAADLLYHAATDANAKWIETTLANLDQGSRELEPEEEALVRASGSIRQALMLLGFAIENAAKALIPEPTATTNEGKMTIDRAVLGHDLVQLVADCGEDVSEDERDVLNELTEWVIWRGRYPVPLDHTKFEENTKRPQHETYEKGRTILDGLLSRRRDAGASGASAR